MAPPRRDISPERQVAFYAGLVLAGIGIVLFFSVFVTGFTRTARTITTPDGMVFQMAPQAPSFVPALVGFVLIVVGAALQGIGRRGLAGSGVILDPQGARQDLEPWSRAAGGMVKDAVEETGLRDGPAAAPEVKVRCPRCRTLNDEDAKFCKGCGAAV